MMMDKEIIGQDKLVYKIEGQGLFEASQALKAANALSVEYSKYVKTRSPRSDRKLLIYNLSKGSLITEFISNQEFIASSSYLMQEFSLIKGYVDHFTKMAQFFLKKITIETPRQYTQANAKNIMKVVAPIVWGNGNNVTINSNTYINTFNNGASYDKDDCETMYKNSGDYIKLLDDELVTSESHQEFRWDATRFSNDSKRIIISDTGTIKKLDATPHKVTFHNEDDKKFMTRHNTNFQVEWQELVYLVDVDVTRAQDKISNYTITKVYREETRTE